MGQVIDAKLISEIPLGDGTAYGLTRLIPGATFERSYALQRPMDNDNLRGMTVTGTISSEFSIDGSSNVVSQARAGIQPPAEAIQEFKVDTAAYDAQIGHTGAGSVNLALKSGTNRFSLAGSFYNRDDSRSEDLFASIRNNTGKTVRDYNRYGATGSGPIFKNKTFFMASFEKLQDDTEESFQTSVPTAKMRQGDFSELLAAGVQIFDPRTARNVGGVVTRDAVCGEHHSHRPAESDRAQHPAVLSGRQRGAKRGLAEQPVRRSAVDLRLQLPDGAGRSPVVGRPAHLRPLAAQLPP